MTDHDTEKADPVTPPLRRDGLRGGPPAGPAAWSGLKAAVTRGPGPTEGGEDGSEVCGHERAGDPATTAADGRGATEES